MTSPPVVLAGPGAPSPAALVPDATAHADSAARLAAARAVLGKQKGDKLSDLAACWRVVGGCTGNKAALVNRLVEHMRQHSELQLPNMDAVPKRLVKKRKRVPAPGAALVAGVPAVPIAPLQIVRTP